MSEKSMMEHRNDSKDFFNGALLETTDLNELSEDQFKVEYDRHLQIYFYGLEIGIQDIKLYDMDVIILKGSEFPMGSVPVETPLGQAILKEYKESHMSIKRRSLKTERGFAFPGKNNE